MSGKMNKKGVLFSTDALIALVVIFLCVLVIYPLTKYSPHRSEIQGDVISVLSNLKVGEIDDDYVQELISQGEITDLNKSVLEQIGEFYVTDIEKAENIADSVLSNLDTNENIGIWYGSELLASKSSLEYEDAENIEVERQVISGIEKGQGIRGYSARAFLSKTAAGKYFYFGGYVGDGNVSVKIDYTGEITGIDLEIAINKEFDIYINDVYSGHYDKSDSEFIPAKYPLDAYLSNFHSGENIAEFRGDNLYIAGGYLKINYETESVYSADKDYNFPGIKGIVNLYDGFYVPQSLESMEIFLHYFSNQTLFLTLGNELIINESSVEEKEITIADSELRNLIDYEEIKGKTLPLRLGLEEFSGAVGTGTADIVFLIDSTGSMGHEIEDVYDIVDDFTQVLDDSEIDYRLGLVEFKDYPTSPCGISSDFPYLIHEFNEGDFTTNAQEFRNKVNELSAYGGMDIPESHLKAIDESIEMNWRENANKFEIMLTDAAPHAQDCVETHWAPWYCGYCIPEYLYPWCANYDLDACEIVCTDTTDETCNLGPKLISEVTQDLVNNNLVFYYINKQDGLCCDKNVAEGMTSATGGEYFEYTESQGVEEIILDIAGKIANLTYVNQTAIATGELLSRVYPDSYISIEYEEDELPYGLIATGETENFDDFSFGVMEIPENASVLEAYAISYSGPRWTYNVKINNENVYNLEDYEADFVSLGDPYAINIPVSMIEQGDGEQENNITIITASSETDVGGGSSADKAVYTIVKPFVSYSKICALAQGCAWNISFENNENFIVNVPSNYSGSDLCSYQPGNFVYNENDAIDVAVYELLQNLDFDSDGKLDLILSSQDLEISSNEITGIPFTWSTE
jgi:hypothetical protein